MKVAIVGSRDYPNLHFVRRYVNRLHPDTEVVSGGARGVDAVAFQTAVRNLMRTKIFPAEWDKYGKSAGYRRNADIVDYADEVVAFWDGVSRGTLHSINLARKLGKKVTVIGVNGEPQEA